MVVVSCCADIQVTFVTPSGDEIVVSGDEGDSLLELAHENDIDIEGGHPSCARTIPTAC